MTYLTNSPEQTEKIGAALANILQPGTVLAYRGDLGAGKSEFTRGLAKGLGVSGPVSSPSFTTLTGSGRGKFSGNLAPRNRSSKA